MGYTHYWRRTPEFTALETKRIRKAIQIAETRGIVIRDGMGEGKPTVSTRLISFNGDGSEGLDHETFYVDPKTPHGFNFTKTARKPYDVVVVAALYILQDGDHEFTWTSDGGVEDHLDGHALAVEAIRAVPDPRWG